ncbi:MAG: response regulator [Thermodesulfobacteria bacterium]|nr:response regulator [Thermodesulfobacteriota bacterium]
MSEQSYLPKDLNLEEIRQAVLDMDQDRLLHMQALGTVLRLMEVPSKVKDEKGLYEEIVRIVAEETGCENVSLLLYRPEKEILELAAATGISQLLKGKDKKFDRKYNKGLFFKEGKSIAWEVFDSQQPLFINDSSHIRIPLVESARQVPRSLACLPISSRGILNISSSASINFTNSLKRNLIIIAQVIGFIIQGYRRSDVLSEGHLCIQNIVESDNRKCAGFDDAPFDYFRAAMENAPQGICLLDKDGTIIHANDSLCKLLQTDETHLKEMGLGRFFMDASVFLDFSTLIRKNLFKKLPKVRLIRPDGTTVLADFFYHPVNGKNGEKKGGIVFVHDLSDHLEDSQQKVREEKLRALGSMAAGIAHDFNNMLMAILGNVELLQMELQGTKYEERLKKIEACVNDGAETIKRIQTFVKGRSGKGSVPEESVDVGHVIKEAVQFTRPLWKDECEKKGIYISVETDLARDLVANISAFELREVLVNLIINAIEAMPNGGKIIIKAYRQDDNIIVEVRDTGVGIDADILPHIFDPYFSTKDTGSSGLGLSIVYGLVSNVGGSVEAFSEKGCGATIKISLPCAKSSEVSSSSKEESKFIQEEGLKILVIDDEPQIAELTALMLESMGHKVFSCNDPYEALSLLEKEPFDLVLTDLGMPKVSGWEIAAKIRQISPDTRVVMMTGWGASFKEEELKEKGIDALLSKPFKSNAMIKVLNKLFGSKA